MGGVFWCGWVFGLKSDFDKELTENKKWGSNQKFKKVLESENMIFLILKVSRDLWKIDQKSIHESLKIT